MKTFNRAFPFNNVWSPRAPAVLYIFPIAAKHRFPSNHTESEWFMWDQRGCSKKFYFKIFKWTHNCVTIVANIWSYYNVLATSSPSNSWCFPTLNKWPWGHWVHRVREKVPQLPDSVHQLVYIPKVNRQEKLRSRRNVLMTSRSHGSSFPTSVQSVARACPAPQPQQHSRIADPKRAARPGAENSARPRRLR